MMHNNRLIAHRHRVRTLPNILMCSELNSPEQINYILSTKKDK